MSRYTLSTLTSFRRFVFLVSILLSAPIAATVAGCGGDDEVAPITLDGGASDAPRVDGAPGLDGSVVGFDGSITLDAGKDSATDSATADASDSGDAGPTPSLSIDSVSANEGATGATSLTFTVTLSAASTSAVTVDYATADGTAVTAANAVGGPDYTPANGTLTFAPGDTSKTVTVSVNGDTTNEADETFTVTLSNPTNSVVGQATGTGTIVNDDAVPAIAIADALVVEGNTGTTPAAFTVSLSAASGQSVTVTYATTDGTATAGSDYAAVAATVLTFAPGETTKNANVDVTGETAIEPNETFTVDLSAPGNATLADATATGTIQNDDGAAQPSISINDVSTTEGNAGTKVLTFTVSLSAAGALPITVDLATVDGTGTTANNDYQATTSTVTFALGETTKNVSVLIVGDLANENDETFTAVLSNPQNAIVADGQGTGTITNDDAVPTVTINDVAVAEGQAGTSALTFTVSLSATSGKAVSVAFTSADGTATTGGTAATGGQDYTAVAGTLVIPAGTSSGPVTVNVAGDVLDETNETVVVTLSNPSNAALGAKVAGTGTITNDDAAPALVIADASVTEGNAGTTNLVFTVSLVNASSNPAPSGRTVTANFATSNGTATAPSDFVATNGTLTFAAGETSQTVTVVINGDGTAETNETFNVTLTAPSNATLLDATAVGTIQNDDGSLPLLNIDTQSVTEGNAGTTTMTFNVTLSATSTQAVTVNYATQNGTAISGGVLSSGGQDYVATNGVLTFAPGTTSQTIAVTINGDLANEADETFNVVLSNVSTTAQIQDGTGGGTITNDDAVPTLAIANATAAEGNAGTSNLGFTVTLSAASGRTITVSYDSADVTATTTGLSVEGGTDYTAVNGTLTFLPGQLTKNIAVPVMGDRTLENDDTFTITLANAVNAGIADATGLGTITNDDTVPTVSIANVTLAEGTPAPNTPNTTRFVFNVTLSNTTSSSVLVTYTTENGTATVAGNDYSITSGTLTFSPGESVKTITVLVRKDAAAEATETFFVNLNASTNSTIADGQAVGTITNDD